MATDHSIHLALPLGRYFILWQASNLGYVLYSIPTQPGLPQLDRTPSTVFKTERKRKSELRALKHLTLLLLTYILLTALLTWIHQANLGRLWKQIVVHWLRSPHHLDASNSAFARAYVPYTMDGLPPSKTERHRLAVQMGKLRPSRVCRLSCPLNCPRTTNWTNTFSRAMMCMIDCKGGSSVTGGMGRYTFGRQAGRQ